jgi:hypothetical protein
LVILKACSLTKRDAMSYAEACASIKKELNFLVLIVKASDAKCSGLANELGATLNDTRKS